LVAPCLRAPSSIEGRPLRCQPRPGPRPPRGDTPTAAIRAKRPPTMRGGLAAGGFPGRPRGCRWAASGRQSRPPAVAGHHPPRS